MAITSDQEGGGNSGEAVASRWLPLIAPLLAIAASLAYWPGLVTWDSLRQYDQALSGEFDDWHPPIMGWIWRQLLPLAHSPAPMLLLQLGLYAMGLLLVLRALPDSRRRPLGWTVGIGMLQPILIALMATIVKDSLMTGALLCATGLILTAEGREDRARSGMPARLAALLLCVFAATLRFNAFPAALPIALWSLPPRWRSSPLRCVASAVPILALLFVAMPVANRLIGAEGSDVTLSLIIFDLGGITEHSGEGQFPPLGVPDPVKVNHGCYTPVKWDSYSWWTDSICPINFTVMQHFVHSHPGSPWWLWIEAIRHHPVAYLEHRATHWNINSRLLVKDEVERPVQVEAPPNDWHFDISRNAVVRLVDVGARASSHTPLGWPVVWMAALAALLWARRRQWRFDLVTVMATSGLLYGLSYGLLSVASELRYYLWTMCAGTIALIVALIGGERRQSPSFLMVPAAVALTAFAYRFFG